MIQLDSADAGQELQVVHVNVVRPASGTILHMDACVSRTIKMLGTVMTFVNFGEISTVDSDYPGWMGN
jgi:hypothetical protein